MHTRLLHSPNRGQSADAVLQPGIGRGYSVREIIDSVERERPKGPCVGGSAAPAIHPSCSPIPDDPCDRWSAGIVDPTTQGSARVMSRTRAATTLRAAHRTIDRTLWRNGRAVNNQV